MTRFSRTSMGLTMTRRGNTEEIRDNHVGSRTQDSTSVSGSIDRTDPPHYVSGPTTVGDGIQPHHTQVPYTKRVLAPARDTIQVYLNLVDWRHIQEGGSLFSGGRPRQVHLFGVCPVDRETRCHIHTVTRGGRCYGVSTLYVNQV
jgi:hypothetical protein